MNKNDGGKKNSNNYNKYNIHRTTNANKSNLSVRFTLFD